MAWTSSGTRRNAPPTSRSTRSISVMPLQFGKGQSLIPHSSDQLAAKSAGLPLARLGMPRSSSLWYTQFEALHYALSVHDGQDGMSENVIRISLDQAGNGKTDLGAIAALSDVQIDARALLDMDTLLPNSDDLGVTSVDGQGSSSAVHFEIYKSKDGTFRWRLAGADGSIFAVSADYFDTKAQALASVKQMLAALGKISRLAA